MITISHHLALQMGLPHVDRDGRCFLQTVGGEVEFNLEANTDLARAQRGMGFRAWAEAKGLPTNPQACAIATGYIS